MLKYNDNLRVKDSAMIRSLQGSIPVLLLAALLAAGPSDPLRAEGTDTADPDADAGKLVEQVLRKAGGNDGEVPGGWARDVIERALGRAGSAASRTVRGSRLGQAPGSPGQSADPLPAERLVAGITRGATGRAGTAEILIFTSLSVPAASWRQWAREAARSGAPLVLRGVSEDGLPATAREIGARLGGAEAGVAIDPRLFRLFGIERVPAVVVVPGGVPPCRSQGCTADPVPPHDLVTGNIGLAAALEAVVDEGSMARDAARVHLRRLEGGDRP